MSAVLQRTVSRWLRAAAVVPRTLPLLQCRFQHDVRNPPKGNAPVTGRGPPDAPKEEAIALKDNAKAGSYLGTIKRLPEFNLNDNKSLQGQLHCYQS